MKDFDDAQHGLEQKSLRNVRALVDNLEDEERTRNPRLIKAAIALFFVMMVGLLALIVASSLSPRANEEVLRAKAEKANAGISAFNKSTESYHSASRRKHVVSAASPPAIRAYSENCVTKIRALGNSTYRKEVAGVEGTAEVTIAIRFDGLIEGAEVNKWSGHAAMEPTARRFVRLAGSCDPFPEEVRKDADVVYVTQAFEFGEKAVSLLAAQPGR